MLYSAGIQRRGITAPHVCALHSGSNAPVIWIFAPRVWMSFDVVRSTWPRTISPARYTPSGRSSVIVKSVTDLQVHPCPGSGEMGPTHNGVYSPVLNFFTF